MIEYCPVCDHPFGRANQRIRVPSRNGGNVAMNICGPCFTQKMQKASKA